MEGNVTASLDCCSHLYFGLEISPGPVAYSVRSCTGKDKVLLPKDLQTQHKDGQADTDQ